MSSHLPGGEGFKEGAGGGDDSTRPRRGIHYRHFSRMNRRRPASSSRRETVLSRSSVGGANPARIGWAAPEHRVPGP